MEQCEYCGQEDGHNAICVMNVVNEKIAYVRGLEAEIERLRAEEENLLAHNRRCEEENAQLRVRVKELETALTVTAASKEG